MEIIIGDILLSFLGWIYLFLKYRGKQKRQLILKNEFASSYRSIGLDLFLKVVSMSGILLVISFLLAVFYAVLKFRIT